MGWCWRGYCYLRSWCFLMVINVTMGMATIAITVPTNAKLSDKPDCVWWDRHIDRHVAGFPKVEQLAGGKRSVFVKKVLFGFLAASCSRTCSMPSRYDQATTSCHCNHFTTGNAFRTAAIEKTMHKRAWHVKQHYPCTMPLKQQRTLKKLRD